MVEDLVKLIVWLSKEVKKSNRRFPLQVLGPIICRVSDVTAQHECMGGEFRPE